MAGGTSEILYGQFNVSCPLSLQNNSLTGVTSLSLNGIDLGTTLTNLNTVDNTQNTILTSNTSARVRVKVRVEVKVMVKESIHLN